MYDSAPLILVAEDNTAIRTLLREVFTDEGYQVTCCTSATAAIEALRETSPDLVISDMQMEHRIAGLHLLQYMRERPGTSATPVIVYSADMVLLRFLEPQIAELNALIVLKPFDVFALVMLAERLTGRDGGGAS